MMDQIWMNYLIRVNYVYDFKKRFVCSDLKKVKDEKSRENIKNKVLEIANIVLEMLQVELVI